MQLYVHWWDYTTSIPEMMQSLNQLVQSGKVLYLGISDTPAWVVRYEPYLFIQSFIPMSAEN